MTASAANGFGEVQFAPTGRSCTNIPYNFHSMYSTSSEDTRVPWTAHSYNIAFSDETGHFSYCNKAAPGSLKCAQAGVSDPNGADGDDTSCFNASQSLSVPISGCQGTEFDFDGVPYEDTWPGTFTNAGQDALRHPSSILFTSPLTMAITTTALALRPTFLASRTKRRRHASGTSRTPTRARAA